MFGAIFSITFDSTVAETDGAMSVGGNVVIVSDENEGLALFVKFVEEAKDLGTGGRIEITRGFVGEDDQGIVDEGAGDGDALLLAAGKFEGFVVEAILQANEDGQSRGNFATLLFRPILVIERDFDILEDRQLLDKIIGLENEPEPSAADGGEGVVLHARDILAAQEILTRGGPIEAAEQIEHGGLATTGRSHDANVIGGLDLDGYPAKSFDGYGTHLVGFCDAGELDDGSH